MADRPLASRLTRAMRVGGKGGGWGVGGDPAAAQTCLVAVSPRQGGWGRERGREREVNKVTRTAKSRPLAGWVASGSVVRKWVGCGVVGWGCVGCGRGAETDGR